MIDGHDLRMPVIGAAAWLAGIATYVVGERPQRLVIGLVVLAGAACLIARRMTAGGRRLVGASLLVAAAVAASTVLRHESTAAGPLPGLAADGATATLTATVVSDPRPVTGRWGEQVVVRVRVHGVEARGRRHRLGARAVVLGGSAWRDVALGERVRVVGRLAPADDPDLAGLVVGARAPVRIRAPDPWWRAAGAVRSSLRASVAHRPPAQRQLVPALVVGDDAGLDPDLAADFRTTGLTHLTAVSGTNLTLLLGFLLVTARWLRIRGRWLHLVGVLGVIGFVLLARTEPSVLRAAVMGLVGLFALGTDGRRRGLRALGLAVTGLLLVWPPLAVSAGFALSVLATGGIVLLGPPLQRALERWLPTVAAQALAVPFAAQLACTPVVAALSAQVSLVAVAANVVVAPAVGPATVLGLAGGLVGLVAAPVGRWCGTAAGWCVGWIALVAQRGADLPVAAIGWGTGGRALAALVLLCVVAAIVAPRLLARRWTAVVVAVAVVLVLLDVPGRAIPWRGAWPPDGWVMVACDVGQGDGLVLSAGAGAAIVVDAGPDPAEIDRCLDRLDVSVVPLLVLTHFHADHIGGVSGVLSGRRVAALETTAMLDPPDGVDAVRRAAGRAGVPVSHPPLGVARTYGPVTLQVLAPDLPQPVPGAGDGSSANDASLVLLVASAGLSLLLTGDVEPPGQARLAAAVPDLDVDVLKVPHHGSRHQDEAWLASLAPEVALVSVGEGNDYGHPAPDLVALLERSGAVVARTDTGGDLAVVVRGRQAAVVTRERGGR